MTCKWRYLQHRHLPASALLKQITCLRFCPELLTYTRRDAADGDQSTMVQNLNIIQWYTISIYRIYINHVQANRASSIQMYYKNVKSSDCVWFIWDLCWLERTSHDEIWWTNEVWFFRNWTPSQYLCGFTTSGICAHPNHLAFAASFHFESIGVGTSKSWRSWRVQQMCQSNVVMLQYDRICHMLWDRPQQCQVQYRQKLQCFCTICPFSFEEMGKGLWVPY